MTFAFLAGLIGAFICEFLIDHHGATRVIRGERIYLQLPFEQSIRRGVRGLTQSRSVWRSVVAAFSVLLQELTTPIKRA